MTKPTTKTAAAIHLGRQRRRENKLCAYCAAEFRGITIAVYCSSKCRWSAHADRHAE